MKKTSKISKDLREYVRAGLAKKTHTKSEKDVGGDRLTMEKLLFTETRKPKRKVPARDAETVAEFLFPEEIPEAAASDELVGDGVKSRVQSELSNILHDKLYGSGSHTKTEHLESDFDGVMTWSEVDDLIEEDDVAVLTDGFIALVRTALETRGSKIDAVRDVIRGFDARLFKLEFSKDTVISGLAKNYKADHSKRAFLMRAGMKHSEIDKVLKKPFKNMRDMNRSKGRKKQS